METERGRKALEEKAQGETAQEAALEVVTVESAGVIRAVVLRVNVEAARKAVTAAVAGIV